MDIQIDQIKIGERLRKGLGDIAGLATSIEELGLLQPIGVTESKELIFGLRRIAAYKLLGRECIQAQVIAIESIADGEIAENEIRKDFTLEERLAIAAKVEERLGERRGRPEKEAINCTLKEKTRDIAGKAAGFGSGETYRQVAKVAEQAPERLVAIDLGETTIGCEYKKLKRQEDMLQREEQLKAQRNTSQGSAIILHQEALDFLHYVEAVSVDLLLTDPPYSTDLEDVETFAKEWVSLALSRVKTTGRAYICTGAYPQELQAYLTILLEEDRFILENVLVWTYRNTLGPSPKMRYKNNWQAIFYLRGVDAGPLSCPAMTEQFAVQDINAPDARTGIRYHEWEKPVELAERLIRHSTQPGDVVIDPFAGTGTFLLAAKALGRDSRGCDNDPEMIKIAVERGCKCDML